MAQIVISIATIFIYMTLWWVVSLIKKRNDIADVAWGIGFIVISLVLFLQTNSTNIKGYIILIMVTLWGVRLATHIGTRHRGKPEDGRYQTMRKEWKYPILQSYTNVFLSQGFFMLLVAAPILLFFSAAPGTLNWYNFIGLMIWIVGFVFESIGDYQLAQFIKNPKNKGKIMRYGLWRYSRHPNYFGEISLWWGFYIFTLFTPFWYLGLVGPLTITFLIIGVSGIPMLEERYKGNRDYENYQKTTSAFFPLPPKHHNG